MADGRANRDARAEAQQRSVEQFTKDAESFAGRRIMNDGAALEALATPASATSSR